MMGVGLVALTSPTNKPLLPSVPILTGEYKIDIAAAFFLFGLFLAYLVFRFGRKE